MRANDEDIFFTGLGTTRSTRPPLTYIVTALLYNASEFTELTKNRRLRIGSSVIASATLVVMLFGLYAAFSNWSLAVFGVCLVGLMPRFVMLAACNNDDIGAIFSATALFSSLIIFRRQHHSIMSITAVFAAIGLVVITKFTAWLCLPLVALYLIATYRFSFFRDVKRAPLLVGCFILFGGWWILFNSYHYGISDPTGMKHAVSIQKQMVDIEPNQRGYESIGVGYADLLQNYDSFLYKSYKSTIGYIDWIKLESSDALYLFYGVILIVALLYGLSLALVNLKSKDYLSFLFIAVVVAQILFYFHHNLVRDQQPQGRYLLPVIFPLIYFFLAFVSKLPAINLSLEIKSAKYVVTNAFALLLISVCFALHIHNYISYTRPIFSHKTFFTSLTRAKAMGLQDTFQIKETESLSYKFIDDSLQLERQGEGVPGLILQPSFCELLHSNTLLSLTVESNTPGGMYVRLDKHGHDTYDDLYWQSYRTAGTHSLIFSIRQQHCSGAKITLSSSVNSLKITKAEIRSLRIHEHGKPF